MGNSSFTDDFVSDHLLQMKKRKLAKDEYEVEAILDMRLKVDDSIRGTKGA